MKKTLLAIALTLMMLPVAHAATITDDDTPVDNKSTYHISDTIDLVTKTDVQYEKPRITIRLVYPSMNANDERIAISDETIDKTTGNVGDSKVDIFNRDVTDIIHQEIKTFQQRVAEAGGYQGTIDKSKVRNRLSIDYSSAIVNLEREPIISVRFIIQGFMTGMKQPFIRYRSYNFDLESGAPITLSDNFKPDSAYLTKIASFVHDSLAKKLHNKLNLSDSDNLPVEAFNNWNINLNGLRISFDDATVAPAAFGSQSVLIPYAALKAYINPESALGRCLEHQRSCFKEHVLTGGFIDTAANFHDSGLNPVLS